MKPNYNEGDLVLIRNQGDWTLCCSVGGETTPSLRSMPTHDLQLHAHPKFKNKYTSLEGKYALVVYVKNNKLKQPVGYRVLIEGKEMFCKAKVAHNHFKLVESKAHEGRRSSKV
tara:strand:- start:590 stop:931 length:342 start_codon:yes stop_codon:yes gene_type:complete